MDRRRALVAVPATLALACARAQTTPVRVLIGFAPGGSVDALARLAAEAIQQGTGRNALVESRTGAAGRIAVEAVKAAAPDGDTLLVAPQGPMTLFPHVFRGLKFDPAKDFVPISRLAAGDYALTIGPAVPAKDIAGLRTWLRTAGDKATYGSPGAGTLPHFVGVSIARAMGVTMTHVPYRGSALAMNDLAGGTLAAAVSPVTEALELHKAGRVHIVATAGAVRSPFVEGVPTLKESGIDVDLPSWFALYAPAATPPATLDRLRQAVYAGLTTPAAKERLARLGLVPTPSSTPELLAVQARERAMWEPVIKASGFTPGD
ncbi:MAG: ABC transporter substrate-binding protein, partial [Ideonella sp.]|nr:ABC transporter substrate-binding protein [Ideonella sp.]